MLEQLGQSNSIFFFVIGILSFAFLVFSFLILRERSKMRQDVELISLGLRSLVRTGRSPQRINIHSPSLEALWRKILAFYSGTVRAGDSKANVLEVLSGGIGITEAGDSEENVLRALSEIVLRSAYPEVNFAAVATCQNGSQWRLVTAAGVSCDRLQDPLLLAVESLPLVERDIIYTRPQNGIEFDFRGIGVGASLFVPMKFGNELIGVVWLGFSEGTGALSEARRNTIEMIVQHAIASYFSARRNQQKDQLTLEKKEKMLSLSHDMKAPGVRALYALRELQQSSMTLNEGTRALLGEIEYALEEQLGLIQSLFSVDSAHNESGRVLAPELEIASVVKSRVESFKVIARAVNISLEIGDLERAKVRMPREALHRILDNLLSNAIKYTSHGTVKVSVVHSDKQILVSVVDSGRGVPERLRPHLFTNMIREKEREVNSGQGYGLTVVKRLSEEYGGFVSYSPNPSGGSIFSFRLPVVAFLDGSIGRQKSINSVLIIDDDSIIRTSHVKWISGMVDRVTSCGSFAEARIVAELERPSLIITDLSIPGENLSDLLDSVHEDTRVVILSARSRIAVEEEYGLYRQVFAVLEKPVTRIQLRELMKRLEFDRSKKSLEKAA